MARFKPPTGPGIYSPATPDTIEAVRPRLVLDRTPKVPEVVPPPAFAQWGGPPKIEIVTHKGRAARKGGSIQVNSGNDPGDEEEEPPPDDPQQPQPGVLVFEEAARGTTEVTVKSADGKCSVTFPHIDAVIFRAPAELAPLVPLGSMFVFKFKAS